jgi:hypothetical protein
VAGDDLPTLTMGGFSVRPIGWLVVEIAKPKG